MTKIDDSKLQMLGKVRRVVTHGGLPHTDDIMACAIAYALGVPHDATIERRNPKPGELDALTILVLDVGGVHDPARLDFDHHQRPRTAEPKCAFKLLSEWLGVDDEFARLFPWYATWNLLDVAGPFALAAAMGTTWDKLEGLVANPLADFVIRRFADDPGFRQKITLTLANGLNLTRRAWTSLCEKERPWKLVVTYDEARARELLDDCRCFTERVWLYPARDLLFFAADIRGFEVSRERISIRRRMAEEPDGVVITTIDGLMDRLEEPDRFRNSVFVIDESDTVDLRRLSERLVALGYERTEEDGGGRRHRPVLGPRRHHRYFPADGGPAGPDRTLGHGHRFHPEL